MSLLNEKKACLVRLLSKSLDFVLLCAFLQKARDIVFTCFNYSVQYQDAITNKNIGNAIPLPKTPRCTIKSGQENFNNCRNWEAHKGMRTCSQNAMLTILIITTKTQYLFLSTTTQFYIVSPTTTLAFLFLWHANDLIVGSWCPSQEGQLVCAPSPPTWTPPAPHGSHLLPYQRSLALPPKSASSGKVCYGRQSLLFLSNSDQWNCKGFEGVAFVGHQPLQTPCPIPPRGPPRNKLQKHITNL